MKKLLTVFMALTMVFGFAAMASAATNGGDIGACLTCEEDPGNINRGCDSAQTPSCSPFDFDGKMADTGYSNECGNLIGDYCDPAKGELHRLLFKICDCINDGIWDTLETGDTVDISMEILVDSGSGMETGDNGVYWAEDVNSDGDFMPGIEMETFTSQELACEAECGDRQMDAFEGEFIYRKANGDEGYTDRSTACDPDGTDEDDDWRVTLLEAAPGQTGDHGYVVKASDGIDNASVWWIDIPEMRVDNDMVSAGDKVYVRVCLIQDLTDGGVCGECEGCCCTVYIGELCCEYSESECDTLYPYFPPADSAYWGLIGMTLSNLDSSEGTFTMTMYETDGDVGTYSGTLAGQSILLVTLSDLVDLMTSTGTIGDSISYIVVQTSFNADGFVMIANPDTGESMGYLPRYDQCK